MDGAPRQVSPCEVLRRARSFPQMLGARSILWLLRPAPSLHRRIELGVEVGRNRFALLSPGADKREAEYLCGICWPCKSEALGCARNWEAHCPLGSHELATQGTICILERCRIHAPRHTLSWLCGCEWRRLRPRRGLRRGGTSVCTLSAIA